MTEDVDSIDVGEFGERPGDLFNAILIGGQFDDHPLCLIARGSPQSLNQNF